MDVVHRSGNTGTSCVSLGWVQTHNSKWQTSQYESDSLHKEVKVREAVFFLLVCLNVQARFVHVFWPDKQAVESIHFSSCPTLSSPRWLAWHGSTIWLIFNSVGFRCPSSLPWMGTWHWTMSDLSSGVIIQLHIGKSMYYEMALVAWSTKAYKHALMRWKAYLD